MASIEERTNPSGSVTFSVRWRDGGRGSKQLKVPFVHRPGAEKFKALVELVGGVKACAHYGIEYPGADSGTPSQTLSEFLTAHVDTLTGVERRTLTTYRAYIRKDIDPVIGMLPVESLTRADVVRWVQHMEESGASGKTMKNKHGFVSGAFNTAIRDGLYAKANPCVGVKIKITETDDMVFLTPDEFHLVLGYVSEFYRPLVRFLVVSGARFSEAAALRPGDVDYTTGRVNISRAWKKLDDAGLAWELGPPKTKKSRRAISVPVDCLPVVQDGQEYLFVNSHSNPLRSTTFGPNVWKKTLARVQAENKDFTKSPRVHDLRHTCASWLIKAGQPLPAIQAHLGHESIQTTVDRYGHLDDSAGKLVADALSSFVTPKSPPPKPAKLHVVAS